MQSHAGRLIRSRQGTAAIEFAIVAPILLLLFAGIVEIGRVYQVHGAVNRLATQYATVWADCSDSPAGACSSELAAYNSTYSLANIVPQLQTGLISLTMFQVSMSGTTPTVVYASPSGATPSATQIAAVKALLTDGQSGVVVTATYNHTLQFFQTLMTPYLASVLQASFTAVQLKA